MEFINIPTALFSSPEYIGAEPIQRATWISLLAWCCEQENGGIIEGCRSWGMRRWMQTCGVTDQEISVENELYHFDGDNLIVFGYPHEIQETLKTKRKTARENGKLGGRPKKTHVETHTGTDVETEEKPTSVISETNVGTEIGTNVAPYVETYPKTVREGKNSPPYPLSVHRGRSRRPSSGRGLCGACAFNPRPDTGLRHSLLGKPGCRQLDPQRHPRDQMAIRRHQLRHLLRRQPSATPWERRQRPLQQP